MKAWRFYGFNNMQLDEIPDPLLRAGHVIAETLCVQPSVTEAQLAYGIRTLAYEQIKNRLETEAPIQLFGHEFCARIVEANEGSRFCPGDRVAARAKLPCGECSLCLPNPVICADVGRLLGFNFRVASLSSLCYLKSPW